MKNKTINFLLLSSIPFLFSFYSLSPEEKAISDFVQTTLNVKTDIEFKVNEIKQVKTITGKDSLEPLQFFFNTERDMILKSEEQFLIEKISIDSLMSAEEASGISYPDYYPNRKERLELIQDIKRRIEILKGDCKGFHLESLCKDVEKYKKDFNTILGYIFICEYSIKSPFTHNMETHFGIFLLSSTKDKVLRKIF